MTTKRQLPLNKRGMTFETFMWYFTRVSALAMYALILTGIIGALIMGARTQMNFADIMRWAFMPNPFHVQNTNITDIVMWETLFWKLLASALLLIASAHGVHGLVVIADDYLVTKLQRDISRYISMVVMAGVSLAGLYIIWQDFINAFLGQ